MAVIPVIIGMLGTVSKGLGKGDKKNWKLKEEARPSRLQHS